MQRPFIYFLFLLPHILCARPIDTFYGSIDVQEPVLLELIDSPVFQRLKQIHQYGVAYYTTHPDEYNRYDHSLGVFAILRAKNVSLEEQIAGLLHDVSHTAFSHVGDWVFNKENQDKGYQDDIHAHFLEESGLSGILEKYHLTTAQVLPQADLFPALESSLPNLCADRIDYNIQGAYYQGFITHDEAKAIVEDLRFIDNRWVSCDLELMKKLGRFSLFMTENCWGSPTNHLTSRWLANAILRSIDLGVISLTDLHYGTDQVIWDKLIHHTDSLIKKNMHMVLNHQHYISLASTPDDADCIITSKFRGIDPFILSASQYRRLTDIDPDYAKEYADLKQLTSTGWPIKIIDLQ